MYVWAWVQLKMKMSGSAEERTKLWTTADTKISSGNGEEGGHEGARAGEDGKSSHDRVGSGHDSGAESEERGDPEIPRGAGGGLQQDPGACGTSGRDRQQGASLRPDDGFRRAVFRQADHPHPREILTDDEGSLGRNPECGSVERNTPAGILPRSARVANRNPLRGGRGSRTGAKSANGCRTQPSGRRLSACQFGKAPERFGAPERTRSSQLRRKSTGSVRSGRGQSPVLRTLDRSRTPDMARTPIRHRTPDREVTPDSGKAHVSKPHRRLLRTAKWWSRSLLHPQGRPPLGIRGLPRSRADNIRNNTPEAILPRSRVSGRGIHFPEYQVPEHHGPKE